MDTGEVVERGGVLLTRGLLVAATLIGLYLLVSGASLLQRVFGLALLWAGLFLLIHHQMVWQRGSMGGGHD
ncbi:MAG: hypothetical protein SVU88_03300 [Candidatus Nanohaloarchaea archaeon]|nr:hypothetical protein [Candidatus Nanohaloarchaea archaeon]